MSAGLILALDTSRGPVSAALMTAEGRLLGHRSVAGAAGQQAEVLPPLVAEMFSAAGVAFSDVGRVVVTTGPGAFTGVRVGVAFAKGLRIATGAVVIGVSSLECLAVQAQVLHPGLRVGVVMDAKRGEVHVLVRDADGRQIVSPSLLSIGEAGRVLSRVCDRPMLIFGNGRQFLDLVSARYPEADICDVDAVCLARHGATLDPALHPLEPSYLRAPDARLPA